MRALLVALILAATALFVVGVSRERAGEPAQREVAEAAHESDEGEAPAGDESRPLGIDVEATPFIALAVVASVALAAAGWLRPQLGAPIAVALLAFAALDIAEVVRQGDRDLAILAAVVAALHLAAAAVARALPDRMAGVR